MSEIEEAVSRLKNECEAYPSIKVYGDDELAFMQDIQTLLSELDRIKGELEDLKENNEGWREALIVKGNALDQALKGIKGLRKRAEKAEAELKKVRELQEAVNEYMESNWGPNWVELAKNGEISMEGQELYQALARSKGEKEAQ